MRFRRFVEIFNKEVDRKFTNHYKEAKQEITLYKQQQNVVDEINKEIDKSRFKTFLLHGVTGSGKTFTMANVIAQHDMPALVISHNKTLAAQLYEEFKELFPENAVEYFGTTTFNIEPIEVAPVVRDLVVDIEKAYENRNFLDDLAGKSVREFIEVIRIKSGDAHFWTLADVLKEPQLEHIKF